jgi:LPXTG-motif cell wall-anchored protein
MRAGLVSALAATSLLAPAGALAQGGGVFIDPGSPTAKEYALPLENARRQANPAADQSAPIAQGEKTSPLFGEGISSSGSKSTDNAGAAGAGADGGSAPGPGTAATPPQVIQAAANPGTPSGGADTHAVVAAVALGVLLVGGGAGLLLRRRRT